MEGKPFNMVAFIPQAFSLSSLLYLYRRVSDV